MSPEKMRLLIHAKIPTEAGNLMLQDPNLLSKLETYIDNVHQHRSNVRTLHLFLQILLGRQMRLYRNGTTRIYESMLY
ncbi:MAG: hypothetical protein ACRD97_09590 [Nitrososphaeraceae archaeon]